MSTIRNYLNLIKFSHTIFAMPFAMIGFFLALHDLSMLQHTAFGGLAIQAEQAVLFGWRNHIFVKFLLVVLCMISARSAAMAFNRWLDAKIDLLNPRTAIREIPSAIISKDNALRFVIMSCIVFIACSWLLNVVCFFLSFVALAVVLGYSYTKRFTSLCHVILGIGLSLAPIGAYLAVIGHFALLPILFSCTVICWVSGFDIIYALQDEEFDRSQHLYSVPSWLGKATALMVSESLHILSAIFVIVAGIYGGFNGWYWAGVIIFTGMLVYQHSIVSSKDLSRINLAFMSANGIASAVFAIFVITDLLLR